MGLYAWKRGQCHWQHHRRIWLTLLQQPLIAYCSSGKGKTLWASLPYMMVCWRTSSCTVYPENSHSYCEFMYAIAVSCLEGILYILSLCPRSYILSAFLMWYPWKSVPVCRGHFYRDAPWASAKVIQMPLRDELSTALFSTHWLLMSLCIDHGPLQTELLWWNLRAMLNYWHKHKCFMAVRQCPFSEKEVLRFWRTLAYI